MECFGTKSASNSIHPKMDVVMEWTPAHTYIQSPKNYMVPIHKEGGQCPQPTCRISLYMVSRARSCALMASTFCPPSFIEGVLEGLSLGVSSSRSSSAGSTVGSAFCLVMAPASLSDASVCSTTWFSGRVGNAAEGVERSIYQQPCPHKSLKSMFGNDVF